MKRRKNCIGCKNLVQRFRFISDPNTSRIVEKVNYCKHDGNEIKSIHYINDGCPYLFKDYTLTTEGKKIILEKNL